jgi:hypothetical protein
VSYREDGFCDRRCAPRMDSVGEAADLKAVYDAERELYMSRARARGISSG